MSTDDSFAAPTTAPAPGGTSYGAPTGGAVATPGGAPATFGAPGQAGAAGTGQIGIRRSPVAQWLMMIIPIYNFVHICSVSEQLKRYDKRVGGSGVAAFFSYIPGLYLLLIPPIVLNVRTARRIRECQVAAGLQPTCSTAISVVLMFVVSLNYYYYQAEMMKIWDRYQGAQTGQQVPLFA